MRLAKRAAAHGSTQIPVFHRHGAPRVNGELNLLLHTGHLLTVRCPSDKFPAPQPAATCRDCLGKVADRRKRKAEEDTHHEDAGIPEQFEDTLETFDFLREDAQVVGENADFAEWLPRTDPSEVILPGQVVECVAGKISKIVTQTGQLFVVSTAPLVYGNKPKDSETESLGNRVALVGQVPINVVGDVVPGAKLVPSGMNDGTARELSTASACTEVIGTAWSANDHHGTPGKVTVFLNGHRCRMKQNNLRSVPIMWLLSLSLLVLAAAATQTTVSATNEPHLLVVGNPGAGKSTILNGLIGSAVFKSGVSISTGVTSRLQWHTHDGIKFGDTPGLTDLQKREQAADEISQALRQNGMYRLIFVVLLDGGRVRADDITTMKLVLKAIDNPDLQYGIIVNRVSKPLMHRLNTKAGAMQELVTCLNSHGEESKSGLVHLYPRYEQLEDLDDALHEPTRDLRSWINGIRLEGIRPGQVSNVDSSLFDEVKRQHGAILEEYKSDTAKMQRDWSKQREAYELQVQQAYERAQDIQDMRKFAGVARGALAGFGLASAINYFGYVVGGPWYAAAVTVGAVYSGI